MDGSLPVGGVPFQKKLLPRNILIVVIVLLVLALGITTFFLTQNRQSKKESTVSLTKKYNNPFDTKTQYVNPFSNYKNPFDNLTK